MFKFDFIRASRTYEVIHDIIMTNSNNPFTISPKQLQDHPISLTYSRLEGITVFSGTLNHHPFENILVDGVHLFCFRQKEQDYSINKYDDRFYNSPTYELIICTEPLIDLATPAFFEQNTEIVYDEYVRKGKEIKADRIEIDYNDLMNEVWNQINKIAPFGKKLVPKLYKMDIYEKGGLFKSHRDTLHAANHFATLVIGLSWDFKGGNLIIQKNNNESHVVEFNSKCYKNKCQIRYAVFVTDAYHEVTEITEGVRIVLQYDLYLEDKDKDKDKDKCSDEEDYDFEEEEEKIFYGKPLLTQNQIAKLEIAKTNEILSILDFEIEKFYNENPSTTMYFLLSHAYPIGMTINLLKEKDKQLYDLLSKKYEVYLGASFHCYETDYKGLVPREQRKKLCVLGINSQDVVQHYIETGVKPIVAVTEEAVIFFPNSVQFICAEQRDYIQNTGNGAVPGYFAYQSMVFAIGPKNKNL